MNLGWNSVKFWNLKYWGFGKMMLSASPSAIARSSLEEMLDSLRRRDEIEKPKDLPPALPSRPTSKARIPPVKRALPVNFRVNDDGSSECSINVFNGREDAMRKENGLGNFAFRRIKGDQDDESPYMVASENDNRDQVYGSNGANIQGSNWEDNISYFLHKVLLLLLTIFLMPFCKKNFQCRTRGMTLYLCWRQDDFSFFLFPFTCFATKLIAITWVLGMVYFIFDLQHTKSVEVFILAYNLIVCLSKPSSKSIILEPRM